MSDFKENVLEWITNESTVTATITQGRTITKIKRLAEKFPDEVEIIHTNADGSILAHLPLRAIKINLTTKRELTEEQRLINSERLRKYREIGQEVDEDDFDEDLEDEE